jgi:hypothetical protein
VAAANTTIGPNRTEACGDGSDLCPRLEGPLLWEAPQRIRHAPLGRIDVDQLPGNGAVEHLPQRLRRFEAMPLRQRPAPGADLLGAQINEPHLTERERRLGKQPAQLRNRRRRRLMHLQVPLDQLGKCHRPAGTKALERAAECAFCLGARRKPTRLRRFEERPFTR